MNGFATDVEERTSRWAPGIRQGGGFFFYLLSGEVQIRWGLSGGRGQSHEKHSCVAAVGGADLGGLAHLLLKLSSDAVVLLDAQRKRLGRFLGLELRLAREKGKISGAGCGRLVHKPGIRIENERQWFFCHLRQQF